MLGDMEAAVGAARWTLRNDATAINNIQAELIWQSNVGYVRTKTLSELDPSNTEPTASHLTWPRRSKKQQEDIVNALEDLMHTSIDAGKLDEASTYIDQVGPSVSAGGTHLTRWM